MVRLNGEGALVVDKDSDLGDTSGSITLGVDNIVGGTNGTLRFDSTFDLTATRAMTLMEGGGTIDTQGYTTNIGQTIAGTGTLTKAGSGILNLNGANSYVGGTVLKGGVLGINSDSALGNSSSRLVMYDTTTLQLNGDVNSNHSITLAGGSSSMMTINTQANNGTFNGNIDGLGGLVKTGSGMLSLYGNNLYQDDTKVKEGTLAINSDASLGGAAGSLELENNTTLKLDGNVYMNSRPVIIGGGDNAILPQLVTIDTQGYTGVISQNIDQSAGEKTELIKTGTGTLGLYGNNTYSGGTWVKNGTVAITSPLSLGKGDVQLGDSGSGVHRVLYVLMLTLISEVQENPSF